MKEKIDIKNMGEDAAVDYLNTMRKTVGIKDYKPAKWKGYARFVWYLIMCPILTVYCFWTGKLILGSIFFAISSAGLYLALYGNRGIANIFLSLIETAEKVRAWSEKRKQKKKDRKYQKWLRKQK